MLQTDRGLVEGEVVIDPISKCDANEGQAVKGGRTDDVDAWRCSKADFHGDGVVALHFLGRETGRLRGDLQDDGRGIGVSLDVELGEGDQAGDEEHQKAEQNDRAAGEPECQQALDHRSSSGLIKPAATALMAASARVVARNLMRALSM